VKCKLCGHIFVNSYHIKFYIDFLGIQPTDGDKWRLVLEAVLERLRRLVTSFPPQRLEFANNVKWINLRGMQ
jgi:hypothetical protein